MELTNEIKKRAFKDWLKHTIDSEYVGNDFSSILMGRLEELYDDVNSILNNIETISSKKIYNEIMKKISLLIEEFEEDISSLSLQRLEAISEEETEWIDNFSNLYALAYTIPKSMREQMKFAPFGSNGNYESVGVNTGERIKRNIESTLRAAFFTKISSDEIKEKINIRKERNKLGLKTDSITFSTAMFRTAQNIVLKNNVKEVIYLAHLDNRTCLICGENHLQRFKVENAPTVPAHENCRCSLIDINLYSDDSPQTYSEFLDELNDDELYEVLGKTRYKMYKAGTPISSFVNDGRILTLKELSNTTI